MVNGAAEGRAAMSLPRHGGPSLIYHSYRLPAMMRGRLVVGQAAEELRRLERHGTATGEREGAE